MLNHRRQRTPRVRRVCMLCQWRGAAAAERWDNARAIKADEIKKEFGAVYPAVVMLDGVVCHGAAKVWLYDEGRRRLTASGAL